MKSVYQENELSHGLRRGCRSLGQSLCRGLGQQTSPEANGVSGQVLAGRLQPLLPRDGCVLNTGQEEEGSDEETERGLRTEPIGGL
jgi:hypothetical protein